MKKKFYFEVLVRLTKKQELEVKKLAKKHATSYAEIIRRKYNKEL